MVLLGELQFWNKPQRKQQPHPQPTASWGLRFLLRNWNHWVETLKYMKKTLHCKVLISVVQNDRHLSTNSSRVFKVIERTHRQVRETIEKLIDTFSTNRHKCSALVQLVGTTNQHFSNWLTPSPQNNKDYAFCLFVCVWVFCLQTKKTAKTFC